MVIRVRRTTTSVEEVMDLLDAEKFKRVDREATATGMAREAMASWADSKRKSVV